MNSLLTWLSLVRELKKYPLWKDEKRRDETRWEWEMLTHRMIVAYRVRENSENERFI